MPRQYATAFFSLVALVGATLPATAQNPTPLGNGTFGTRPHVRPRIEVNPAPRLLYRRCADWYELQYRPSGTVLFPAKHCWWERG
jgi:hypothetical protein